MGPVIEELARVSVDDIAVGKLDTDQNPITSLRFNIQSIPMFLIYKDGKQADVLIGYDPERTPEWFRNYILGL